MILRPPVRSSTKSEDVIPVEPEMARSLRAKFENWTTSVDRDNNNKSHNGAYDLPTDYTPQTDTTKHLKAKFESFRSDAGSKPLIEKRKPRVSRFVVSSLSCLALMRLPPSSLSLSLARSPALAWMRIPSQELFVAADACFPAAKLGQR